MDEEIFLEWQDKVNSLLWKWTPNGITFDRLKGLRDELNISMSDIYKLEKSAFKKIRKHVYYDLDGFRDNPVMNYKER